MGPTIGHASDIRESLRAARNGGSRSWIVGRAMTVTPLVAIVAMGCLLTFGLVVVLKARPEDLPKIFGIFTRWFGK
jgi:hypothetical protein